MSVKPWPILVAVATVIVVITPIVARVSTSRQPGRSVASVRALAVEAPVAGTAGSQPAPR